MRNFSLIILLCSLAIYLTAQQETPDNNKMYAATEKTDESPHQAIEASMVASTDTANALNDQENPDADTSDQGDSADCIFDKSTQTDEFVRGVPEFAGYSWDDASKTATILLPAGDTLYATRGGCDHFAFSGKWVKMEEHAIDDVAYWLEQGKWISKNLFPRDDYSTYLKMVQSEAYEAIVKDNSLYVLFSDSSYNEWSLTVEKGIGADESYTSIETGYYIN